MKQTNIYKNDDKDRTQTEVRISFDFGDEQIDEANRDSFMEDILLAETGITNGVNGWYLDDVKEETEELKTYEVVIEFESCTYRVQARNKIEAQQKAMELHVDRECSEPDSEVGECIEVTE